MDEVDVLESLPEGLKRRIDTEEPNYVATRDVPLSVRVYDEAKENASGGNGSATTVIRSVVKEKTKGGGGGGGGGRKQYSSRTALGVGLGRSFDVLSDDDDNDGDGDGDNDVDASGHASVADQRSLNNNNGGNVGSGTKSFHVQDGDVSEEKRDSVETASNGGGEPCGTSGESEERDRAQSEVDTTDDEDAGYFMAI
jgi:hypothetical protein